jgi:hypothetical protein
MRDYDQSKDIYEHDHTDITRKGEAIIHQKRHDLMYSKYQPETLDETEDKVILDQEVEDIKNMGLSKYLRLISEQKIVDDDISMDELSALKSLRKKYQDKIHYRQTEQDLDHDDVDEGEGPSKFNISKGLDQSLLETPYRGDTPIISLENTPARNKSILKSDSHYEIDNKQKITATHVKLDNSDFIPPQTKFRSNNDFTVHEDVESLYLKHSSEVYETKKSYLLDDKTLYFTNGPFYKDEMHDRVERHHQDTVRNPNKSKFVKPYLNKVHGSYYTGKNKQRAHYSSRTISNQEFIDRAHYDV